MANLYGKIVTAESVADMAQYTVEMAEAVEAEACT
jgi:hypothetical protein